MQNLRDCEAGRMTLALLFHCLGHGYRAIHQRRSWLHILVFTVITVHHCVLILGMTEGRGSFELETSEQFLVKVRQGTE